MCLDHPDKVIKAAIIDIVPTLDMWAAMDKDAAIGGWHWPFMAQPADFPERMLGSVPADWFMRKKLLKLTANLNHIPPAIWDEYVRCFNEKTIRGSCGDYRAAATIDCELDTADLGRKLAMPILVLWGKNSSVGKRFADPVGDMAAAGGGRARRGAAHRALCQRGGTASRCWIGSCGSSEADDDRPGFVRRSPRRAQGEPRLATSAIEKVKME